MKEYKYQGETFQLDDSKGCYVEVTYKYLTGYLGVNLGARATDQNPYVWEHGQEARILCDAQGVEVRYQQRCCI